MRALLPLFAIFVATVSPAENKIDKEKIRYVAIGDSYSIGEGASPNESWPAVLTRPLNEKGLHGDLGANPSRTGWTTRQAIERELPVFIRNKPNFATLQIGGEHWGQSNGGGNFRKP